MNAHGLVSKLPIAQGHREESFGYLQRASHVLSEETAWPPLALFSFQF